MKTSESLINISKAMAEAQKKINHATKDSKNPHFRNDYASLESVINASKEALLNEGIFVVQSVSEKSLVTRLQHTSGEFFESALELILSKNDMQGLGSAITYARRYSLASMLNISQADDDGNEASKQSTQKVNVAAAKDGFKSETKTTDLANYVVQCGKKYAGMKLSNMKDFEIAGYIKYLDEGAAKNGKPLSGDFLEFHQNATAYLASLPKVDESDSMNF